ncbi:MAG: helix-turn-helix domain-containing protein [Ferruginibacter sp.]
MQTPDAENEIFNVAANFIRKSNHPIFLTGKAGTGKTTFLKYIRQQNFKNTAIIAPTGVAAINAGGTTIHSFFSLPLSPFIPVQKRGFEQNDESIDKNSLLGKLKLSQEKKEIMQQLELLVIDEISMVRCDVLDAIDLILRHVRKSYSKPYGGVQVLYIGDMYQLPPVVKDDEWSILRSFYQNPFFFSSHICTENPPVYIELKKVYRQSDENFIALLNKVRNNEMDRDGYELLHERYQPDINQQKANDENIITLTTHNAKAEAINESTLRSLPGQIHSFKAVVAGEFYEKSFPAEETLVLKVGSQVMFLKNDMEKTRRYYNGKIGVVSGLSDEKIEVTCDKGKEKIEVRRDTWKTIKYTLNKKMHHIEEEELGSFTQFPLRLAWAITIHKSQGLTFEKAIIDAGQAFSPGQVYVALSRCTTLQGLYLKSKITYGSLQSDERIVAFSKKQQHDNSEAQLLAVASKQYQEEILLSLIDFKNIESALAAVRNIIQENFTDIAVIDWEKNLKDRVDLYNNHSIRFVPTLINFFNIDPEVPVEKNSELQTRMGKAAAWFVSELKTFLNISIKVPADTDNRNVAKDFTSRIQILLEAVDLKIYLLQGIIDGFGLERFLIYKSEYVKPTFVINCYSGRSTYVPAAVKYPELYIALKEKRDELCAEFNLPVYMVCSTESIEIIANALPQNLNDLSKIPGFGVHRLKKFGATFLGLVQEFCLSKNLSGNMAFLPEKKKRSTGLLAKKTDTKLLTYDLYRNGKSLPDIALERNLALSTIEGHLAFYVEKGKIDIIELITQERRQVIEKILKENTSLTFSELKQQHPQVTYSELRLVQAAEKSLGI